MSRSPSGRGALRGPAGTVTPIGTARRPRQTSGANAVAAGAARATGERARQRRSTLLDVDGGPAGHLGADVDLRAVPDVEPEPAVQAAPMPDTEQLVDTDPLLDTEPVMEPEAAGLPQLAQYAIESLVEAFVAEARRAGVSDIDERIVDALAWLRRRLSGDYSVDEFGFDAELTKALLPLLRPLYRSWFRVEVRGIKNVPSTGGALIVANHSGAIALDSLMTQLALLDEHPAHRHLRLLGADLVFATPVIGEVGRKIGATVAGSADAERLLRGGELVGVWPEGFKGIGKPFSERYKLQRFGRGGFVSAALQTGAPIVPCSIVGAEETYPILGDFTTLARLLGLPYLPMTPTFPWLGPLGLVPLPSKWILEFGEPIRTEGMGDASDDPMLVFDLTDRVRETIQQTLYSLLLQRRSAFF